VKGISLRKGDHVVEMDVLRKTEAVDILTVTDRGFGKRTAVDEYRLQSRGGMGVINIKTTDKNGKVMGIKSVTGDDQLLLITEQGKIIRVVCSSIRTIGRSTQGVRLINVDEADRVVGAVKLMEKETNGDDDPSLQVADEELPIADDSQLLEDLEGDETNDSPEDDSGEEPVH
jgi:DNA gyrase subunit A